MNPRTPLLILSIGALALASCGGDDDGGETDTRRPPDTADRLPVERRQAPPAGVAEQVSFFEIGNGGCPAEADAPEVSFFGGFPEPDDAEIGRPHFKICPVGFAPESPIDVTVRRPDGREVGERTPAVDDEFAVRQLDWLPLPGDPVGRYGVTASQGSVSASGEFTVRRPSTPRVTVIESWVPPGETAQVIFAGFAPRESVRFHVYRAPLEDASGRLSYLTSMTARVDENGETLHELRTDPGAPEARYLVRVKKNVEYPFHLGEEPAPVD